jgi:hypothetical protein
LGRVSGDRLADVRALDVDPEDLGRTDRLGAERIGNRGTELLGEEPLGVPLRLPQRDDAQRALLAVPM